MKKFVRSLVTVLILLTTLTLSAQEANSKWLSAMGGLNSNWIVYQNAYGNPEIEYSTTFGLTGGMGLNYYLNDIWGVSASLFGSKLGQSYAGVQSGGDAERKVKLTYLEIPFVIMKNIPYASNPTWISFGPDIMVLMNAQQEYLRTGGDPLPNPYGPDGSETMKVGDVRNRFNSTDVALTFALNKMYKIEGTDNAMFVFSFNTSFGLTDINDIEWRIPQLDGSYTGSHNFYIGLKAGLMFKVSKDK
jgi:hypothetical protein